MVSTEQSRLRTVGTVLLWLLSILAFLDLTAAGLTKFLSDTWPTFFVGWGYPAWFALVIGGTEMLGALLLVIPPLASYAASVLIVIMLGAIWTVLSPTNGTQLGPIPPMINIALLSMILVARWRRRWRPGAHTADSSPGVLGGPASL